MDEDTGHYVPTTQYKNVLSRHNSSSSSSFSRSWNKLLSMHYHPHTDHTSSGGNSTPHLPPQSAIACAAALPRQPSPLLASPPASNPSALASAGSNGSTTTAPLSSQPPSRRYMSQLTQALQSAAATLRAPSPRPPSPPKQTPMQPPRPSTPMPIPSPPSAKHKQPSRPVPLPPPEPRRRTSIHLETHQQPPPYHPPPQPRRSLEIPIAPPRKGGTASTGLGSRTPPPLATRRSSSIARQPPRRTDALTEDADSSQGSECDSDAIQGPLLTKQGQASARGPFAPRHDVDKTVHHHRRRPFVSEGAREPLLQGVGPEGAVIARLLPLEGEQRELGPGGLGEKGEGGLSRMGRPAAVTGDLTVRGAGLYAQFLQQQQEQQQGAEIHAGRPSGARPAFRSEPTKARVIASSPDDPSNPPSPSSFQGAPLLCAPLRDSSRKLAVSQLVRSSSVNSLSSSCGALDTCQQQQPPQQQSQPQLPRQAPQQTASARPEQPLQWNAAGLVQQQREAQQGGSTSTRGGQEQPDYQLPSYVQQILAGGAEALQQRALARGGLSTWQQQQQRSALASGRLMGLPYQMPSASGGPAGWCPSGTLEEGTAAGGLGRAGASQEEDAATLAGRPIDISGRTKARSRTWAAEAAQSPLLSAASASNLAAAVRLGSYSATALSSLVASAPQGGCSSAALSGMAATGLYGSYSSAALSGMAAAHGSYGAAAASSLAAASRQSSYGDFMREALSRHNSQSWGQQFLVGSSESPVLV